MPVRLAPTMLPETEDVAINTLLMLFTVKLLVSIEMEENVVALAIPFTSRGAPGAASLIPTLLFMSIVKEGTALLDVVGYRRELTPVSMLK